VNSHSADLEVIDELGLEELIHFILGVGLEVELDKVDHQLIDQLLQVHTFLLRHCRYLEERISCEEVQDLRAHWLQLFADLQLDLLVLDGRFDEEEVLCQPQHEDHRQIQLLGQTLLAASAVFSGEVKHAENEAQCAEVMLQLELPPGLDRRVFLLGI
jgi:hypothetical protein